MFVSVGGPTGPAGTNGAQGLQGEKGEKGDTGTPGPNACNMKTGTYTGDGSDNRAIDIAINLAAKTFAYVIVKADSNILALHRIEYGQGDKCMGFSASGDRINGIQTLSANGFIVGTDTGVNQAGIIFRYIAFWVD